MEKKVFKFDIKTIDESGDFEGYAAVFNVVDLQKDCILPGAFSRTLQHKGGKVPLLDSHYPDRRAGVVYLEEDNRGLFARGKINTLSDVGRNVYADMKFYNEHGVKVGLSIGYDTIKETWKDGIRYLHEIRLWEVSFVTFPAQPDALISDVKTVVPFQDLPLADMDRSWDADAAVARVRVWAGGPDKDEIDWAKYRKAFLWYDAKNPDNYTSYKLPIADVIKGRLYAIPRGIFAAAAALQGARGGVDLSEEDIERCKRHLEKYYKKMDRKPPWEDEDKDFKYGRVLSARNEQKLREAIQALQEILEALSADDDSGKSHSSSTEPAHDAEDEVKLLEQLLKTLKGGRNDA